MGACHPSSPLCLLHLCFLRQTPNHCCTEGPRKSYSVPCSPTPLHASADSILTGQSVPLAFEVIWRKEARLPSRHARHTANRLCSQHLMTPALCQPLTWAAGESVSSGPQDAQHGWGRVGCAEEKHHPQLCTSLPPNFLQFPIFGWKPASNEGGPLGTDHQTFLIRDTQPPSWALALPGRGLGVM